MLRIHRAFRSEVGGQNRLQRIVAEGVGFEPTIRFPVYTLSKRAPSATRPSLRGSRRAQYSRGRRADNPQKGPGSGAGRSLRADLISARSAAHDRTASFVPASAEMNERDGLSFAGARS